MRRAREATAEEEVTQGAEAPTADREGESGASVCRAAAESASRVAEWDSPEEAADGAAVVERAAAARPIRVPSVGKALSRCWKRRRASCPRYSKITTPSPSAAFPC